MRKLSLIAPLLALLLLAGCGSDPAEPNMGNAVDNGAADSGAGDSSSSTVVYPPGPYGNTVGSVLRDFSFIGLRNPKAVNYVADSSTLTTISMHDFYNPTCDSAKPRALVVTASALWCSACKEEAKSTMKNYNYWHPKGIEFVSTVFEDEDSNPSEFVDLTTWAKTYSLEYPTVLDPSLKLGEFFNKSASPFNMIVDTCTMQILVAMEGVLDTGAGNVTLGGVLGE